MNEETPARYYQRSLRQSPAIQNPKDLATTMRNHGTLLDFTLPITDSDSLFITGTLRLWSGQETWKLQPLVHTRMNPEQLCWRLHYSCGSGDLNSYRQWFSLQEKCLAISGSCAVNSLRTKEGWPCNRESFSEFNLEVKQIMVELGLSLNVLSF